MELCLVTDHACNLRCSYCYAGHKKARPMAEATAERAIDFALARDPKTLTLSFFGGEPLLRLPFIEHTTRYAKGRLKETNPNATLAIHLNTNGTLVDDRVCEFVGAQPVVHAFVSLDGPAEVHDRHRVHVMGGGSFAEARDGLLRLSKAGANVFALAVINPDTASATGDVVRELFSLPLARAHVACNLRTTWDHAAIDALRRGLAQAMEHWKRAFRDGKIIHLEPLTTKILSHLHAAMPCGSRCQFALSELVVAPSGRFYSCSELVGNDETDGFSIGDLDQGIDHDKLGRMRADRSRIEGACEGCDLHERCSSSCGCKHVALTGKFGAVTDTLCNTEAAFIEAADALASTLHAEGCEAFLDFFYRKQWVPTAPPTHVALRRKPVHDVP
ncbi:MAG: radical SAM protein [Polyangiaceae bacterium]